MDHDAAIAAIQDGVNKDFDEELVRIFVNIPKEDVLSCLPKRK
jgi:HD-GYP domain-containing protein (c-di-GMP phosphodiesterase class II)